VNLVDIAVIFMGGYVLVIIAAGLVMTLRTGAGGELVTVEEDQPALQLRQRAGVMPDRAWGFRPPVQHSHYEPAPWQVTPPQSAEDSLDNVDRATEIKRELGSEHPPWERLDRQGL